MTNDARVMANREQDHVSNRSEPAEAGERNRPVPDKEGREPAAGAATTREGGGPQPTTGSSEGRH